MKSSIPIILGVLSVVFLSISSQSAYSELESLTPLELYNSSELILVGNVISLREDPSQWETEYDIKVEKYLKNPKSFSLITVVGAGTKDASAEDDPLFNQGDRVLLYLNTYDGKYRIMPFSFKAPLACDEHQLLQLATIPGEPRGISSPARNLIHLANTFGTEIDTFVVNEEINIDYDLFNNNPHSNTVEVKIAITTDSATVFHANQIIPLDPCTNTTISWNFTPTETGEYTVNVTSEDISTSTDFQVRVNRSGVSLDKNTFLSPLKQFRSGIPIEEIQCNGNLVLLQKHDGSPACVKPDTKQKLIERGWAINQESDGTTITIGEGQREGSLLVQKILSDSIEGLNFPEYPIATNVGYPITLHIGDKASNGCTVELTLVKINNNTATFLKKEYQNRPCPICLSENTEIDTPNGPINIKELKDGMAVLTQDHFGNKQTAIILKTGKTLVSSDHKMIHVILDDKRELHVSPNHPTSDGRLFGKLLLGDILDGSEIKSVEQVQYNGTYTYDILPSDQTGTYWANGILVKSTLK